MQVQRNEPEYDYYDRRPSDLLPLKRLNDWHLAEGEPDVRGYDVVDRQGESIGKIDDLLVSREAKQAIFAIISYGDVLGIGGKRLLMPLDKLDFDTERRRGFFDGVAQDLKGAPDYANDTRDYGPFYDFWSGRRAEAERQPVTGAATETTPRRATEEPREKQVGEVEAGSERVVRRTKLHVFRRDVEPREVRPGEQVIREGEEVRIPIAEQRPGETRDMVTGEIIVQPETVEEEEEEEHALR